MKRNMKGITYRKTETRLGHDLKKRVICLRFNEASDLALKFIHPLLDIADFSEQVSAKVLPNPFSQHFLIPFASVEGSPPLNLLYAYGYNNVLSCFLANWVKPNILIVVCPASHESQGSTGLKKAHPG
jgi:hypothetical protein